MSDPEDFELPPPIVMVATPCTCEPRPRWFRCRCDSVIVAEYECAGEGYDGTGRAHPDHVAQIAAAHPGMSLIY